MQIRHYSRTEFGRSFSTAVHEHDTTSVRVVNTHNGQVVSERVYDLSGDGERDSYFGDLDARMAGSGYTRTI